MPGAITVHGLEDARAGLRAAAALGRGVTFVSAPSAGVHGGPLWFVELIAAARAEFPNVAQEWIVDCGAEAGRSLAALRAGLKQVVYSGDAGTYTKLAQIAAQLGATILREAPPALDLRRTRDPDAACKMWLA